MWLFWKTHFCHISQTFSSNFQSMDMPKISTHFLYNSWKTDSHVPHVHWKFQLQTLLKNLKGWVFAILMPFFNKVRFSWIIQKMSRYFWQIHTLKIWRKCLWNVNKMPFFSKQAIFWFWGIWNLVIYPDLVGALTCYLYSR